MPARVAFGFLALLILVAVLSPWVRPADPAAQELTARLVGPSWSHPLGTDSLGRDNLSRLIEGTRVTLWAAAQAIGVASLLGIPAGLVGGFAGRWLGAVLNGVSTVLLAFPPLILSLAMIGVLGPGLTNAMIATGLVFAPRFFRIARAAALSVRTETYIEATRAAGCSTGRILRRHVLPNSSAPLLVQLTFAFGQVVVIEASLSFLGLGARPPLSSWGSMLRDGFNNIYTSSFQLYAPSILIVLTILAFSTLGDALRDALAREDRTA